MKTVSMALLALSLFAATTSSAATLTCWDTYFTKQGAPFMTANIESFTVLTNAQFASPNENSGFDQQSAPARIVGTLIQSNHSPYAGYNQFTLNNGSTLILPTDLTQHNLLDIGQGYFSQYDNSGSRVNAVIVAYSQEDGEGGGHYSFRLHCESDVNF